MVASESRRVTIASSLLAADFVRLREAIAAIETAGADWLHLNVKDGHFAANRRFGPSMYPADDTSRAGKSVLQAAIYAPAVRALRGGA